MNLYSFLSEMEKIADIRPPSPSNPAPMTAMAKGPSLPRPGGLKPPPLPPMKLGAVGTNAILPGATAASKMLGAKSLPRPTTLPAMFKETPIYPWERKFIPKDVTHASMTSNTVPPQRLKVAAELTSAAREDLPKKDFAVPASKSNTGEKAYPIPDKQHARSALGFAKMHGDTADYHRVLEKVKAKYPDMIKDKTAGAASAVGEMIGRNTPVGKHLLRNAPKYDLGGLGIMSLAPVETFVHEARQKSKGERPDNRELTHAGLELAGLGTLAAPTLPKVFRSIGK